MRYNALVADGRLLVMGVVDDIQAIARGLRLRLTNRSDDPLYPRYELSPRDLDKLLAAVGPAESVVVEGRRVGARWTLELTAGGSLRLLPVIDGVVKSLQGGHGARLAIEDGDLVETVDSVERSDREQLVVTRNNQRAALAKARPALLKATGAKRATLVDDDDLGWPFLRAPARIDVARLLALQARVPGLLVADEWELGAKQGVHGVRLYAPMTPRELALGTMWAPERASATSEAQFGELVDALVAEAGARIVHVASKTLYLWPTKRTGALAKSQRLLRKVCSDPELEAKASDYVKAVRAGEMLTFWWD